MCAKVTGPLMSLDASGTVGKTTVFSKWKGRNYVRLRVTPMNPRSAGQAQARQYMGGAGYCASFVLTAKEDTPALIGSEFYIDAKAAAPAGQSWISNFVAKLIGTAAEVIAGLISAYDALGAGIKTIYDDGAETAGMADFNISYGELTAIPKGCILFFLAWFAETYMEYAGFAAGYLAPEAGEITTFLTYLSESAGA